MHRYYIHFIEEAAEIADPEGFEATDSEAARLLAMKAGGQIVAEEMARGTTDVAFTLCLDDESGRRIATLPIRATTTASTGDLAAVD